MRKIEGTVRKRLKLEPSRIELEYNEMMEQLKIKFRESQKVSDKVQILVPKSWTRRQAEFGATYHMARLLVASQGVLAAPNARPGKVIPKIVEENSIYPTLSVVLFLVGRTMCPWW